MIWEKVKTFFITKDVLTFLVFLLLSTAIWWMHAMHSLREKTIDIPVQYTGVPENVDFTTTLPKTIAITICDAGNRLNYYSKMQKAPIVIDLEKQVIGKSGDITITAEQIRPQLIDHLQGTTKLQEISPDYIQAHYFVQESKLVPIILDSDLEAANQYIISHIDMSPTFVTIYGERATLDTITGINTKLIKQHDINDTTSFTIDLEPIEHIRFGQDKVTVNIEVEQFTEKVFNINILKRNIPAGYNLRLFPSSVKVTTKVAISHFNEISEKNFSVFVNYPTDKNATKLSVNVNTNNNYILDTKLSPSEVEYLIEK